MIVGRAWEKESVESQNHLILPPGQKGAHLLGRGHSRWDSVGFSVYFTFDRKLVSNGGLSSVPFP